MEIDYNRKNLHKNMIWNPIIGKKKIKQNLKVAVHTRDISFDIKCTSKNGINETL